MIINFLTPLNIILGLAAGDYNHGTVEEDALLIFDHPPGVVSVYQPPVPPIEWFESPPLDSTYVGWEGVVQITLDGACGQFEAAPPFNYTIPPDRVVRVVISNVQAMDFTITLLIWGNINDHHGEYWEVHR